MENKIREFLKTKNFPGDVIFARISGSWSHNLNIETSDIDFSGVYVAPTDKVLGIDPPTDTLSNTHGSKPDFSFHELGKFCRLLAKGNPNSLEMLFTNHHHVNAEAWLRLVNIRDQLLSLGVINQYVGFAVSQLNRIETGKSLHTTGGDYNEKWAYHSVRLLQEAISIKSGNGLNIWKEDKERDFLLSIRHGKLTKKETIDLIKMLLEELKNTTPKIPEKANLDILNKTLVQMRIDHLLQQ